MPSFLSSLFIRTSIVAAILTGSMVVSRPALADDRWGFGSGLGFTAGTVNNTVFTLGFNLDYYFDRDFSVGPMMLLTPTGDLFQFAFAGAARYHLRLDNGINLVPFIGFGLIHVDLDKGTGPGSIDRNDTSWYLPIGLSLEYQLARKIALTSSLIVNLHDINLSPSLPDHDTTSVTLLFGFNFGP